VNEDTDIFWLDLSETTGTGFEYIIGCKCGCENEDECHGESGCNEDKQ